MQSRFGISQDLNEVIVNTAYVPLIWESPIYRFVIPVGKNKFKQVNIDVTRSAPTALTETGKELRETFDWALNLIRKRQPKVLDFGAGRLRNVPYLLQRGCK